MTDRRLPLSPVESRDLIKRGRPDDHGPAAVNSGPGDGRNDLLRYWSILKAHRRLLFTVVAVVVGAVALGTALQPRVYRATATLEIKAAPAGPTEDLLDAEVVAPQYLETQYEILRSSRLARRVIEHLDLPSIPEFGGAGADADGARADAGGADGERIEAALPAFRERLMVDPVRGSRLVDIAFEARDPELAAAVVDAVVREYVGLGVAGGREAANHIGVEADSARSRLARGERRLQTFAANNALHYEPGGGGADQLARERLRELEQQLTLAEGERYRAEARRSSVGYGDRNDPESDVLRSLRVQVAELRGEYARLRSTFTDSFPRTREARLELEAMEAELAAATGRIQAGRTAEYDAAVRQEALLKEAVQAQRDTIISIAERATEYRILQRDLLGHEHIFDGLQQRQKEAELAAALAPSRIGLIAAPVAPVAPVRPLPGQNLTLGLLTGLILGLFAVFLREYMKPSVRSAEELRSMSSIPVLGLIPSTAPMNGHVAGGTARRRLPAAAGNGQQGSNDRERQWLRIDRDISEPAVLSEAFGGLRTAVMFSVDPGQARVLQVTSAHPGDGKTTVATNLALSLVKLGRKVLLVDGDMRRASVHLSFDLPPSPGLADHLAGTHSWSRIVSRDVVPGLDVLTAGEARRNAGDLLTLGGMEQALREARSTYDFVIVDSPAMLVNAPDGHLIARLVDGTLVVIRSGSTPRESVNEVLAETPRVLGVVLNGIETGQLKPYYASTVTAVRTISHAEEESDPGRRARTGTEHSHVES